MHTYIQTQQEIQLCKQRFSKALAEALSLTVVEAPLLSEVGTGIQDGLSGTEQAVAVKVKTLPQRHFEVVHSLAKWKRQLVSRFDFAPGSGILTHMRALRPDEEALSERHSVYVDQWDWEQVIAPEKRTLATLKARVRAIYQALLATEQAVCALTGKAPFLSKEVTFIHTQELVRDYPELSPKEREKAACKAHGSVFLMGIGAELDGAPRHDVRAPDYDDWSTVTSEGFKGLNGDLLVWHPKLEDAFELSSMGIRVDKDALTTQMALHGKTAALAQPWHQSLLSGELKATIGGGIGQSRVAMLLLQKTHIGQVQVGVWPTDMHEAHQLLA